MKAWLVLIVFAVAGAAIGMAGSWREFAGVEERYTSDGRPVERAEDEASSSGEQGPTAKVVVTNGDRYDFGVMDRLATRSHVFLLKNEGQAPLTLQKGETTCKCTISTLADKSFPPGATAEVRLEWKAKEQGSHFSQSAEIITNDPLRRTIRLTITGRISDPLKIMPPELVFTDLASGQAVAGSLRIVCFRSEPLQLGTPELEDPESAPHFEVSLRPMTGEELAKEDGATNGYVAVVHTKPSLPIGPINQKIRIPTSEGHAIEIPLKGNVIGEISFAGRGVTDDVLRLGAIEHRQGSRAEIQVLVKGEHREGVNLRVGSIDPAGVLKATLGEPRKFSGTHLYPLTIEIPADAGPMSRIGTKQAPAGVINLESDHPQLPVVPLKVQFVIEG